MMPGWMLQPGWCLVPAIWLVLVACERAEPTHETPVIGEPSASPSEPAEVAQVDPEEALRQTARVLADAPQIQSPTPPAELRVDLEQLQRRRRRKNPTPSPDWLEPAPGWGRALELPGPQLDRDMPWYPEHAAGACEVEYHRWPPKSGPHDDGAIYGRMFVVERAHGQPSVLWVDRLDDGIIDVEVRARWLTPSRLEAIEERPRRRRPDDRLGKRWEYGPSGELLGGWSVSWGFDDREHERNDWLIDYDERLRPIQIRHYDDSGRLYVLGHVTWDERPLRLDGYRPTAAEPGVYGLDSSIINFWQDGLLRQDAWLRLADAHRPFRTSIHAQTPTGLRPVLHVNRGAGGDGFMEAHDGGRMMFEYHVPATRFERRQTYLLVDGEALPVTREARELPGDWRVEERWDRSPDRVEHWQGGELVTIAYLDCNGRPRPERAAFE